MADQNDVVTGEGGSENSRLSRRRFLAGLSGAGATLLLAACGSAPAAEAPAAATSAPAAAATSAPAAAATSAPAAAGGSGQLRIIWAEWDPANFLQELVQGYPNATVEVVQEPWGSFADRVFTEFAGQGQSFDLVIGDSQWLGQGAEQGHYVELTDVFNSELNGEALAPATVTAYAEYPKGGDQYWAYPTQGDACGWAYRTDLFEDPAEQEAFKARYNQDLAVPTTWEQFINIAEFFTRPDQNLYGVSVYTQKDYDGITMGYQNLMFSYGADWGDPQTFKVDGILNGEAGVKALEDYKKLYGFSPPGSTNAFFQEALDQFTSGQVVMSMNFFAFFPGLANEATNPFAATTGFFANPAGPGGDRYAALGGQGMSIVKYISPEQQAAAMEFLKWFATDETQQKWAELGGYTCNANILNSPAFLEIAPYNAAFAETMTIVKDFWAVPVYGEALELVQRELHNFVVAGQGTAQETLDRIATEKERIFTEAGLLKA